MTFTSERHPGSPVLNIMVGPKSGPVLLFLHGLGRFSEDFLSFASSFAAHWQVVALDFRGHGKSGRAHGNYFVQDYARDTVEFIGRRFSEPITIYGHSLGAMVALAAAATIPSHVRGIILEDPPFHTMGRRIHETHWHALFTGMQEVCRKGGGLDEIAQALGNVGFPSPNGKAHTRLRDVRSPEALAFGAKCLSGVDPSVFNAPIQGRWLDGYDERELCTRVHCPSLLLQGDSEAGAAFAEEDAAFAEKTMLACQRIRFQKTGHLIRAERPGDVLKAVRAFTAQLPPIASSSSHFMGTADAVSLGEQPIRNQNSQSKQPYV